MADDLSPMAQEAIGYHVMFTAFCEGGFTADQALRLIANVIVESGRNQPEGDHD